MIEIRGLTKRFGKKVVLDGLDLAVPRGKNTVVIGGSGTGKSVLIKCVVGLLRADAGEILIGGGGGAEKDEGGLVRGGGGGEREGGGGGEKEGGAGPRPRPAEVRHAVPGVRPVRFHERRGERGVRASQAAPLPGTPDPRRGGGEALHGGAAGHPAPDAGGALGGNEEAGRPGPCDRLRDGDPPLRRADHGA